MDHRLFPHQIRRPRKRKILKNIRQQWGKLFRQKEQNSVPLQRLCWDSCGFFASSRVSELQVWKRMYIYGDKCHFRHVEAEGKPCKRSKKGGAKASVAILKETFFWVCVSQDSYPRKSIPREPVKLGTKHAVKFSKGTWHQIKIRERKGPSRGIIQKWAPHERRPCPPKFAERSHEDTLHQGGCTRKAAWDLVTIF